MKFKLSRAFEILLRPTVLILSGWVMAAVITGCSEEVNPSVADSPPLVNGAEHRTVGLAERPVLAAASTAASKAQSTPLPVVTVFKSPTCGCCSKWVAHLEAAGFTVNTEDHRNMSPIKQKFGVPDALQSCHTAKIGDYIIEGHVPADDILRLLDGQPDVAGLAVPGMPKGSPGMEHPQPENYATIAFQKDGSRRIFAEHGSSGGVSYADDF